MNCHYIIQQKFTSTKFLYDAELINNPLLLTNSSNYNGVQQNKNWSLISTKIPNEWTKKA